MKLIEQTNKWREKNLTFWLMQVINNNKIFLVIENAEANFYILNKDNEIVDVLKDIDSAVERAKEIK